MESGLLREAEIAWPPAKGAALAAAAGAPPPGKGAGAGGARAQDGHRATLSLPLHCWAGGKWKHRLHLLWIKVCLRLLVRRCRVWRGNERFRANGASPV